MSGTVHDMATARLRRTERPVKRAELEKLTGYSARMIQQFVSEGMPVHRRYKGFHLYLYSDCDAWLARRYDGQRTHSTGGSN